MVLKERIIVALKEIAIRRLGKTKHSSTWIGGFFILATTIWLSINVIPQAVKQIQSSRNNVNESTIPVTTKNFVLRIIASGKVVPIKSVNVSPTNPGMVKQLMVEQGDYIRQGDIIAYMDSAYIKVQIAQAKANISKLQAQLDQLIAGSRPQDIAQAKARLTQAQALLDEAKTGNRPQEIAQAQAQVDAAKAKVLMSGNQVSRYGYLYEQGASSKQLLDQYISQDKVARANLRKAEKYLSLLQSGSRIEYIARRKASVMEAKAALELLESGPRREEIAQSRASLEAAKSQLQAYFVDLENTIIRAPFNGVVMQKYANMGAFVTPTTSSSISASATSSSIVALASGLEILAQVPESDIGRVRRGQEVEIVSNVYPNEVFQGRVRLVAPEAIKENGVTLFQVKVSIITGKQKLISGLNLDLTLLGKQVDNALTVPTVAIVTEKGDIGVLVPDAENQPLFRSVTIGSQIEDQTHILSGLKGNDRIFINPPKNYKRK
ncbi:HlyD family secretion protein [Richelia intracellularis HH01]|jgi:HlyD family secretion protein|uniref:HlyD family secretion protein n=1 Tax=Richelia intracellularis HH01 TaxID=1165094 RepID=M1X265_9NOST|nr:efflux RND transporter periplasmic adaptor subunit [Richelia intracellularis]CCH66285.1 HlyD family secretion protein [Richelia intracellularis HH01]HAE06010.1 efflux RND transporter periplasmic adaptor subunit [Richelia sp.]